MSVNVNDAGTIKNLGIELSEGFTINGIDKIYEDNTIPSGSTTRFITLPRDQREYQYLIVSVNNIESSSTINGRNGVMLINVPLAINNGKLCKLWVIRSVTNITTVSCESCMIIFYGSSAVNSSQIPDYYHLALVQSPTALPTIIFGIY